MPQPQEAVRPAHLPAAAEGGPVPVAARLRVPVVQVAALHLARHQDGHGRVEQAELHRLAAVDVQRRAAEAPGNDAEIGGVQDGFKRRAALQVAAPEGFLVVQEDEVSAPVVQVGQCPACVFGMRRRGKFCSWQVRIFLLAGGGYLVGCHRWLLPWPWLLPSTGFSSWVLLSPGFSIRCCSLRRGINTACSVVPATSWLLFEALEAAPPTRNRRGCRPASYSTVRKSPKISGLIPTSLPPRNCR